MKLIEEEIVAVDERSICFCQSIQSSFQNVWKLIRNSCWFRRSCFIFRTKIFIINGCFINKEEELAVLAAQQYYICYEDAAINIDKLENSLVMYLPEENLPDADENNYQRWLHLVLHAFRKVSLLFGNCIFLNHAISLLADGLWYKATKWII